MDDEFYDGFTETELEAINFLQDVLHNKGYAVVIMHPRDLFDVPYHLAEFRIEIMSYFVLKYGTEAVRALAHLDIEENDDEQG